MPVALKATEILTKIYQYGIGNLKKWRFLPDISGKNGVNAWVASFVNCDSVIEKNQTSWLDKQA